MPETTLNNFRLLREGMVRSGQNTQPFDSIIQAYEGAIAKLKTGA